MVEIILNDGSIFATENFEMDRKARVIWLSSGSGDEERVTFIPFESIKLWTIDGNTLQ